MLSTLFPPICLGCGRLLLHADPLALCTRCRPLQARLPDPIAEVSGIRAVWAYDGPLARAVVALKFAGQLAFAGPLGRLLADDRRLRFDADGRAHELVVAVPLHWRRRFARGFDQSEELTRSALDHASRTHGFAPPLGRRVLRRIVPTRPQTDLDAHERERNVAGAFEVRRVESIRGRRVLIVDDVTTTGATAIACRTALLEAGASSVACLALLRTV